MNTLFRHIPTNDAELNALIAQQKVAMQKYFGLNLSKQPNKLRDCVCEGLGYTNGGYQQLKAEWLAREENPLKDMVEMGFAAPQELEWNFYVSKGINQPVVREKIKAVLACLGSEEHAINRCELLSVQAERWGEERTHYSVPVLICRRIVGYAKTNADAAFLSGVLLEALNLLGAPLFKEVPGDIYPQLLLRQSSMDHGLLLDFNRITVVNKGDDWELLVETPHYGTLTIDFEPKTAQRSEKFWFNGLPCDFMIAYSSDEASLTGQDGSYTFSRCEFMGNLLEVMPLGAEDASDTITVPLSNKICLSRS